MKISVIVPCHNKASVLPLAMDALARQTLDPGEFEIIVVDDGSTDGTRVLLLASESLPGQALWRPHTWVPGTSGAAQHGSGALLWADLNTRVLLQEHRGAGAARNLGASVAAGKVLLFLDADIVLQPGALCAHLDAHARHNWVLCASRVLAEEPDPIGIENSIFQRSYDLGDVERVLPGMWAITQALSVKADHFSQIGGFAIDLPRGQDIEFGYRAASKGFQVWYCPGAVGRHHHAMSLSQRCRSEWRNHEQLVLLLRRLPQLAGDMRYLRHKLPIRWRADPWPRIAVKLLRQAIASRPVLWLLKRGWAALKDYLPASAQARLFWMIVGSYQVRGLRAGVRKHGTIPWPGVPNGC